MDEWYFAKNDQQLGPITRAALREMASNGQLQATDLVWTAGMSQWAPASTARGLFPASTQLSPSSVDPDLNELDQFDKPEPRQLDQFDKNDRDLRRISRRERSGRGGTSKSLLIAGAVGFVVLLLLLTVGGGFVLFNARTAGAGSHFSFNVKLQFEGQDDARFVQFQRNQRVHITVTTTKWRGHQEPDVDLYVLDADGNDIALDDGPEKDCAVTFIAPRAGTYKIIVRLDSGADVECTVRH